MADFNPNKNELRLNFKNLELTGIVIEDLEINISFVPMSESNQSKALNVINCLYKELIKAKIKY